MPRRRDLVVLASAALAVAGRPDAPRAQEQAVAGVVARREGSVIAVRSGGDVWLEAGSPIFRGDGIRTGPGAKVRIDFAGGLVVVVGPATEVGVEEFLAGGSGGGSALTAAVLDLLVGIVRLVGPAEAGPARRIEVRTRVALASVRSTEWLVESAPAGTGVFVREGRVEVRGLVGAPVVLEPGFGTDVPPGGPAATPRRWGEARRDAALARTTL